MRTVAAVREGPDDARAGDDVRRSGEIAIAYQVHGDGPYDLLLSGTTGSNVETVWTLPEAHRLYERLGRFARIIRCDWGPRIAGHPDEALDERPEGGGVVDARLRVEHAHLQGAGRRLQRRVPADRRRRRRARPGAEAPTTGAYAS